MGYMRWYRLDRWHSLFGRPVLP
ncbi:hypothetical protein RSOL_362290 [Rhizoctonia solani AG-3 Rhs1AP]|uniref:Uncharacterized protein n=1 Tax=Rhizoctonia solani AG-3 Rhs1AP TaxID=1086054 RepID=X8JCX8_9AGAM|nr:hypothetical protein RSOL_362290 [Rhizoctonia solani AG-3 Rhs1AP]